MTLSERKQRKIFDMLRAEDSVRKITKTVHVAQSTVQEYKKIYDTIKAGKVLPLSSDKTHCSSRSQSIIAFRYEFLADQPDETPRNHTPHTTDALTSNQQLALCLSLDLEQSQNRTKELEQNLEHVTDERDKALEQLRDLTYKLDQKDHEKEQLNQSNIQLTTTLEAVKQENKERQDTVNKQRALIEKMRKDHERELEEQNKKANQEKTTMQNEHNKYLQKIKDDVTTMITKICDLTKTVHDVTGERDKLKSELESRSRDQDNNVMKGAVVGGFIGFGTGIIFNSCFQGGNNNPAIPIYSEEGKNTGTRCEIIPILEEATIQPDSNDSTSGVAPEVHGSNILYSGAISQINGATYGTGYDVSSHQHYTVSHPDIPGNCCGGTRDITTSGSSCSGVCIFTSATIGPLQDGTSIQYYSLPQKTPSYCFPLVPPDDPSNSFLMKQIKMTTGPQFEKYLERFFKHLGYRVTLTKASGDKGGDLILELGWETIVIQAKQWKQHVGTSAIQEAIAAKIFYNVNRAIVICTSEFTEEAKKLASKIGVECWGGKQLLEELYKHGYFYPPELSQDHCIPLGP